MELVFGSNFLNISSFTSEISTKLSMAGRPIHRYPTYDMIYSSTSGGVWNNIQTVMTVCTLINSLSASDHLVYVERSDFHAIVSYEQRNRAVSSYFFLLFQSNSEQEQEKIQEIYVFSTESGSFEL